MFHMLVPISLELCGFLSNFKSSNKEQTAGLETTVPIGFETRSIVSSKYESILLFQGIQQILRYNVKKGGVK